MLTNAHHIHQHLIRPLTASTSAFQPNIQRSAQKNFPHRDNFIATRNERKTHEGYDKILLRPRNGRKSTSKVLDATLLKHCPRTTTRNTS